MTDHGKVTEDLIRATMAVVERDCDLGFITPERVRYTMVDRKKVVKELHGNGLSSRQIAKIVGVSYKTVDRDLGGTNVPKGETNVPPAPKKGEGNPSPAPKKEPEPEDADEGYAPDYHSPWDAADKPRPGETDDERKEREKHNKIGAENLRSFLKMNASASINVTKTYQGKMDDELRRVCRQVAEAWILLAERQE